MPHDLNLRKAIRGGSGIDLNPPGPGVGVDRAPSAGLDLVGAAAPVAIPREPAPEIPAQALPEAPALPPSQAQPSRSLIPTFDDDPVGFISLALRDVGAALQGLPSPVRELQKLEAQRRDSELKSLDISLRVLSAGRKQLEGVPADQREAAAREFGAQFDLPVDIGKLLLRTSEIPNLDSVLEQFGDETNQRIVQDMTNGDLEAIIGLTKDGDFMARMEAATDERLLPMVTAKLGAITEIIQNQASQSAGLERALASFETDEDGRTIIGLADLERLITNLPANLALTPAEFGVLKRNGDTLLTAGINTPELTAKIAETEATRKPLEQIAAEGLAGRQTPEEAAAVVTAKEEAKARLRADGTIQRRITKSADGFFRYDDGTRVYPNVEKAEDQGSRRYQNLGAYVDKDSGKFVGEVTFDTHTKKRTIVIDGVEQSVPSSVIPITESDLHLNAMTANNFFKLATEIEDTERGLRELTRFMDDAKDTGQGFRLLADQFLGHMNTIFGDELTEEQFKTFASTGRLQGLLGAYRKEVVGGGVMTEQDARRVIARLGGDFDLTRNRDVAAVLIRELLEEKLSRYNNLLLPQFNGQLTTADRRGFTAKKEIKVDESVFSIKEPAIPNLPAGFEVD